MRKLLAALILGSACVNAIDTLPHEIWQPHVDIYGRTNGYRRGAGFAVLLPLWQQPCSVTMVQSTWGRWFDQWSGSAGLVWRRLWGESCAWGVNGFADFSRSNGNHSYFQIGIGAEVLGECWEARINGYFPFASDRFVDRQFRTVSVLVNTQVIQDLQLIERREFAYSGFDIEAGYGVGFGSQSSIWGYAGYYYFDQSGATEVQGPRLRVEYRLDDFMGLCGAQLIVGGYYEYDRVHRSEGAAEIGIRFPLSGPSATNGCGPSQLYRRMGYRVIRNEAPWVETRKKAVFSANGLLGSGFGAPLQLFRVNNETIADAMERARAGDILVLEGPVDWKGDLLPGMRVYGYDEKGKLALPVGGDHLELKGPKGRARLVASTLELVDGAQLTNLDIRGKLVASDATGIQLRNVVVSERMELSGAVALKASGLTAKGVDARDLVGRVHLENTDLHGGVEVMGGTPYLTVVGSIQNGNKPLLRVLDTDGGGVELRAAKRATTYQLDGRATALYSAELKGGLVGDSVEISRSKSAVEISGARVGLIQINDSLGSVAVADSQIEVSIGSALDSRNSGDLSVTGCRIAGLDPAIYAYELSGHLVAGRNTMIGIAKGSSAVRIHNDRAAARVSVVSNTIEGSVGRCSALRAKAGARGSVVADVTGNTVHAGTPISIEAEGDAVQTHHANNRLDTIR